MNLSSIKNYCLTILILNHSLLISSCKSQIVYPQGGYSYPTHVDDTTFYCYPLKDKLAPFDSLQKTDVFYLFKVFDEYNLSIKPAKTPVFRLTYVDWHYSSVIALMPDEIIVKMQTKLWRWPVYDTAKLNPNEREDFQNFEFLAIYYDQPYYRKEYSSRFDSITKLNPRLLDITYYKELLNKAGEAGNDKFEYSITRVPISDTTFAQLETLINESGYWQLPFENECDNIPSDASTFILEANTPKKYKFVYSINCPDDTTKLVKACQELINYAGMGKEIRLIWSGAMTTDEPIKGRELKLNELKEEKPASKKKKKGQ